MIPLYKLFVVSGRLFAKPIVNLIKKRHKSNTDLSKSLQGSFFIRMGKLEHKTDLWMNRKILSIRGDDDLFVKPLNNEVALEKGVEFFYEILIYGVILGLTLYELNRTSNASKETKLKLDNKVQQLEDNVDKLLKHNDELTRELQSYIEGQRRLETEIASSMQRLVALSSSSLKEIEESVSLTDDPESNK